MNPGDIQVISAGGTYFLYYFYDPPQYILVGLPYHVWGTRLNNPYIEDCSSDNFGNGRLVKKVNLSQLKGLNSLTRKYKHLTYLHKIIGSAMCLICIDKEEEILKILREEFKNLG